MYHTFMETHLSTLGYNIVKYEHGKVFTIYERTWNLHGAEPPVELGQLRSPYFVTYPTLLHLRFSIVLK